MRKKTNHPSHALHLPRLRRVKGQIVGIEKMILDGRYCADIIVQLRAASAALRAIESQVFHSHLESCVRNAFASTDKRAATKKIQEILKMIY